MYLIINGHRHTVSRRIKRGDFVKYIGVTPAPEEITGGVVMYRNDGFPMSEDNTSDYARHVLNGSILELTNEPEPQPPTPPTEEQLAARARAQRDRLLAETDWTQVLDAPIDGATQQAYREYRQALRDVPEQEGFPYDIQWPEEPVAVKAAPDPVDDAVDVLLGGNDNA